MKTRGLFLSALLMGAVMAGCSNEEVMNDASEKSAKNSENYVAVNIVAPGGFGSRGTDGGYANGATGTNVAIDESKVSDAIFVFYDKDGGFVDVTNASLSSWADGTENTVDKVSSAVIVLSNPKTWPTQMVTLLNTGADLSAYRGVDLDELLEKVGDYSSTESFVMSNSLYHDGNKEVTATALAETNIATTVEAAKTNPVQVYVERVLAKVEADASEVEIKGVIDEEGKPVETALDGEDVEFEVSIKGMALVHTNPESYLIKNIASTPTWDGWNDATNFRSYWATSAASEEYETLSWSDVENAKTVEEAIEYCHENTSATTTKLLVAAQFTANGTYQTVFKFNGTYFTETGLKNYILNQYFGGTTVTVDDMSFVPATDDNKKDWHVELKLADTEHSDIVGSVNAKNISQWTDGMCYYYVDVEHFGPEGYDLGVVRNHWYKLTINSIAGLGTPVVDPDQPIDPDKPEEENFYVAAQVNILKWKMVSQTVDLQ